jgi:bifunctional non-homologous end joining protein LigD
MADQLSLRLEADKLPDLPDLRPMLARPLPAAFDSDEHLFEPWWGGERALVLIGPADTTGAGEVRIQDATGREVTAAFPELAGLAVRVDARSAILDGELVVVDSAGRADSGELARRLAGEPGRPVAFLAFDLLHLDGRALISQPLVRRRQALRRVLRPGDEVVAVPAIATEGVALFDAVVAQGVAGILARQRQSPYLPGVRSRLWRYIAAVPGPGGAAGPGGAMPESGGVAGPVGPGAVDASDEQPPTTAAAPILALISRLPFDEEA